MPKTMCSRWKNRYNHQKAPKWPSYRQKWKFSKTYLFYSFYVIAHSTKEHIFEKFGICSLLTDRQTDRQRSKDRAGLSEFLTSAHHQGEVQLWPVAWSHTDINIYTRVISEVSPFRGFWVASLQPIIKERSKNNTNKWRKTSAARSLRNCISWQCVMPTFCSWGQTYK